MNTAAGPEPVLIDGNTTFIAQHFVTGAAWTDAKVSAITGAPVGPAVLIKANALHRGRIVEVVLLLPATTADAASHLREALLDATQACRDAIDDPSILNANAAQCEELNRRAGFLPGLERPRCPGCGAQLFAEVAVRGGCLACYPDLGPLEEAAELGTVAP